MIAQVVHNIKHAIGLILRRWKGKEKKMNSIAKKWKFLSAENNWKHLLEPLDIDLRRYIIHYGEMAQATYDAFDTEKMSKFAGSSRYLKKDFFSKVNLEKGNPFKYRVTKFLYATSNIDVPDAFIIKSLSREAWSKESNWIGYVAVATDEGKAVLGRRDIVIAWRGTVQTLEWINDLEFILVSASNLLGDKDDPKVNLEKGNPFKYRVTKFLYATSNIDVPDAFIIKSLSREAWSKESNWIGYVAVATDEGKAVLGRRDIVIAWRGTVQTLEWINDLEFILVSASNLLGDKDDPKVLGEIKRLVEEFKNEEISITVTGHSLGAAFATLNAVDIVANRINELKDQPNKACPETAIVFASPRVGDSNFKKVFSEHKDLQALHIRSTPDLVPDYPFIAWHNLEGYLHGVAGKHGTLGGFRLEVHRDIVLVNEGRVSCSGVMAMCAEQGYGSTS
nr:phospholipase a1-iigamma [Quercus suber]